MLAAVQIFDKSTWHRKLGIAKFGKNHFIKIILKNYYTKLVTKFSYIGWGGVLSDTFP